MADISLILTNAGRAALVNAPNTGTVARLISHCGVSSSAVVASPAATTLPGEIKRLATLSGGVVADDTLHLTIRDESADVYSLRSLALYLDDGTLFAIYGQPAPIMEKSAGAMMLLALDAQFVGVDVASITFGDTNFLNPPATETVQGVIEIATQAEADGGADDGRAITPKKAQAALLTWLLAQDGAGSGVDADLLDGQHASAFLQASLFTGAQLLSRLVTVDGAGSGLDADLLDGQHASAFLQASLFTGAQLLSRLITVDGTGSGLDADLLDGQHGAYYADIAARLGFTPLNAAHYTALDALAKVLSVDGAGSGVDADLLDGQHGAFYADIAARLGFTPANKAGDTFTGAVGRDSRFYLDLLSGNPVLNFDTNDYLRFDRTANDMELAISGVLHRIMHAGNDGAGSGFDADMLDGQHASAFLQSSLFTGAQILSRLLTVDGAGSGLDADLLDGVQGSAYVKNTDFSLLSTEAGYLIFPFGLAFQWKRGALLSTETTQVVTWPLAFTTIIDAQVSTSVASFNNFRDAFYQIIGKPTITNCTVGRQAYDANTGSQAPILFAYGLIQ